MTLCKDGSGQLKNNYYDEISANLHVSVPPSMFMAPVGYSYKDPAMREGVKLLIEEDDWNPDSCPRELGLAELSLP